MKCLTILLSDAAFDELVTKHRSLQPIKGEGRALIYTLTGPDFLASIDDIDESNITDDSMLEDVRYDDDLQEDNESLVFADADDRDEPDAVPLTKDDLGEDEEDVNEDEDLDEDEEEEE